MDSISDLRHSLIHRLRVTVSGLAVAAAAACASAGATALPGSDSTQATPDQPAAADTALIERVRAATAPVSPEQIVFDWSLQDRDARLQGRGVLRVDSPYRARLDLFGPQDVEYVRAVLLGDRLEYQAAADRVPLPPPAFLWSLLGVFRTPPADLSGMTGGPDTFTLRYRAGPEEWTFRGDSVSLRSAEWVGEDGGRRSVELTGPFTGGRPARATYRDWREFRELTLKVTARESVAPFDPAIWNVSLR